MRKAWLWLGVCLFVAAPKLASADGLSVISYFSERVGTEVDWVGQGQEGTLTQADGTFSASVTAIQSYLYLTFYGPDFSRTANLFLRAPGGGRLQPGWYENAVRSPDNQLPGLDFGLDHRGCNLVIGRFGIFEIAYEADGSVTRLAAALEQRCEGYSPAIIAHVRYNSTVPVFGMPFRINLESALNGQGCVEATGPDGASVAMNASGARDGLGGTNLSYQWTVITSGTGSRFTDQVPIAASAPTAAQVVVHDAITGETRTQTRPVCASDTTPPRITINQPTAGATVGGSFQLDVTIEDVGDPAITSYEVFEGTHGVIGLDPSQHGHSVVNFPATPAALSPATTKIVVRARDRYGNLGQASVDVVHPQANP